MSHKITVTDKFSGEVVAEVKADSREDLQRKIDLAYQARDRVKRWPWEKRAELARSVGERICQHREEFVRLLVREAGQARKFAEFEVDRATTIASGFDRILDLVRPRQIPARTGQNLLVYEPYGVAAIMTPRNTPLVVPVYTLLSGLGAGNAVVMRPSLVAPLNTLRLVELVRAEVCPEDAVQVSTCAGEEAAREFIENPKVGVLVAYASSPVGKDNLIKMGRFLEGTRKIRNGLLCIDGMMTKYVPELAGNDAFLVLPGADLEKAVEAAVQGGFANAGQLCISAKRLIVDRAMAEEFKERLRSAVSRLKVGDPFDPQTDIGPIGRRETLQVASYHVEEALEKGGRLVFGGQSREPFFYPTLIELDKGLILGRERDEKPFLWVEESFAPVRSMVAYDDLEEAIALARDGHYGLGAAIFGPPSLALEVAARIDAGRIIINESPLYGDLSLPIGGVKDSGLYGATDKILEMTYMKRIHIGV